MFGGLGVILFSMLIGAPPFPSPQTSNTGFDYIVNGRVKDVLLHWKSLSDN